MCCRHLLFVMTCLTIPLCQSVGVGDERSAILAELHDVKSRVAIAAEITYRGHPIDWKKHTLEELEDIDERMATAESLARLGAEVDWKQYTLEEEIMMVKWNPNGEDFVLPLYDAIHTPFLEVCEGPFSLDVRHLTEDIPYGLVTFSSLGKLFGVPTPYTDAIITLSEGLLDRDFRSIGRTIEDLGLEADWSIDQIKTYLHEGRRA